MIVSLPGLWKQNYVDAVGRYTTAGTVKSS